MTEKTFYKIAGYLCLIPGAIAFTLGVIHMIKTLWSLMKESATESVNSILIGVVIFILWLAGAKLLEKADVL